MVFGAGFLYSDKPEELYILHILLFLSIVGSFVNTHLFNPSKDKYYAMILMRMNAREYTLTNYTYSILKTLVGFLITLPIFGLLAGFPLWLCLVLPFCIVGMKLFAASVPLYGYGINGKSYNESRLNMLVWIGIFIFLALAYGLPLARITLPMNLSILLFICCLPLGVAGAVKIYSFKDYLEVNKELLVGLTGQMDKSASTKLIKQQNEKRISTDSSIVSSRKGFEYLNELFIKRHKKILWSSALKIFIVCLFLITGALLAIYFVPEIRPKLNRMVMLSLPYFTFIMYAINRGTNFTQALFMNCDHSLLTYSFYKRRTFVLRLFVIRLREIVKINALPALTIAVRARADTLLFRWNRQLVKLSDTDIVAALHEYIFLGSLSDNLLSAAALQRRYRAEERYVFDYHDADLSLLFYPDAAANHDSDIRSDDDSFQLGILRCRLCACI